MRWGLGRAAGMDRPYLLTSIMDMLCAWELNAAQRNSSTLFAKSGGQFRDSFGRRHISQPIDSSREELVWRSIAVVCKSTIVC